MDFTNIVDESKQLPLDIDLGFRANGEVIQSFLYAEIGKNRLDDRQPPGIDLPAFWGVDAVFHLLDQVGMQTANLNG